MSHEATNWAIKQRGLKPTTKIVLWHLCDRFNPDYGCFPSQDRLAHDCEISRSTLNDHLGQLEAVGLLRRVPRLDPVTKRQLPTRYILGFEPGFTPVAVVPCPEIGHCACKGAEIDTMDEDSRLGSHPWLWCRVRKSHTAKATVRKSPRWSRVRALMVLPTPCRVRISDTGMRRGPCPIFRPSRVRKMPKAVSGIRTLTL